MDGPLSLPLGPSTPENDSGTRICSARGCQREAHWAVLWNNPKLHTPDRRKLWAACDEHRESLADFLRLRGFLRDVVPLSEAL